MNVSQNPTAAIQCNINKREQLLRQKGAVIWFTGLSGAGKTTLASALENWLMMHGHLAYLLDGDMIRRGLNRDLGFSHDDRMENIRRIAETSRLFIDCGVICLTAFITPYHDAQEIARNIIGDERFYLVYVSTPLSVCETRDTKGLYKRARVGEISDFTGISSPYEPPLSPSLNLNTQTMTVDECVHEVLQLLMTRQTIRTCDNPTITS